MHKHFSFLQWEGSTFNFSQKSWVFSSNKNMGLTTKASFKVHLKGCMVGRAGVGWRVGQPSMQSMFSWEGVYGPKNAHQTETWGCRNNLAKTDWPETADMCSTIVQEASQLTGALGKKPSTPPSNPAPSSHLLPWVSVYVTFWSGYQKLDYSPPQPADLNSTSHLQRPCFPMRSHSESPGGCELGASLNSVESFHFAVLKLQAVTHEVNAPQSQLF